MEYDIKPGIYRHFKGNEYEVIGIAKHSENEEDMVVYRALYGSRELWVRPASMWNETVVRGGKAYQRFTYVETETEEDKYEYRGVMDFGTRNMNNFLKNARITSAAEACAEIEAKSFPANEACTLPIMTNRIQVASDQFVIAVEKKTGKTIGFTTAIATNEEHLRDAFFTNTYLHDRSGKNIMILSLAVLPEYRGQGIGTKLVRELLKRQAAAGKTAAILTCVPDKITFYEKIGFVDQGESESEWGGEQWHELIYDL